MAAISNSHNPVPPDENPPGIGAAKIEDNHSAAAVAGFAPGGPERVISSFPPRLVPYKLEPSPGLRRSSRLASSRIASSRLPAASPSFVAASDEYIEERHKEFMKMNKEMKEKKRKKGLQVETRGLPLLPVPRSHNPSRDPSPSPPKVDQTLFSDERLQARNIDITDSIAPAERQVSLAPIDPTNYRIAPLAPLPGTDRPTPFPHSPLPVEADDPDLAKKVAESMLDIAKKVAESMLDIAIKDVLDRLSVPVILDPPGDEKLALPQLLAGPWERIRVAMQKRMACPYAKAKESALTPVELRLWGSIHSQVTDFANEVSVFLNNFNSSTHEDGTLNHVETVNAETHTPEPAHFAWTGDDVALAMQSAVFAITGEFITWERALQRASDFDAAHRQHHTPPEGNALGLTAQAPMTMHPPPATSQPPLSTLLFAKPAASPRVPPLAPEVDQATKTSTAPAPPTRASTKTWAKVVAPNDPKPTPAKGTNPPIRNVSAIQKELSQIKASKAMPTDTTEAERNEDGWNTQRKGKKTKVAPVPVPALPAGVIPLRRGGTKSSEQGKNTDLEVAFKPDSPLDVDMVKARANPNESRSCLMRLLKHCNELTSSKEYKDKTDIRVKSFSYSHNGNCIAVFTPKTTIKEVELFAPGLCGVMGLRGTVTVQRTSGWTRMHISHFPVWATDPDTGEWLERINTKEEIFSIL
ncbi:hypothetical protein CTheo_8865 [Ceratobasidium theobromae]|uniref:Uncharacterized protein n=1 Tax=Ceratobasidium theobromae TaxID=1582974 RepID=A0A5N5Q7I6_9AGAM|nr:hypothetical protein CTheo_8865 [Ceratobasidium theobromae]